MSCENINFSICFHSNDILHDDGNSCFLTKYHTANDFWTLQKGITGMEFIKAEDMDYTDFRSWEVSIEQ